ncbi:hypothetical protein FA95DRAFT_1368319 [Auriscalpium vulgare]|uniref:Uncharacterized protein n=1 Tax=Auriscalpium vulgare TaxID=40419 RepID=A0ACB8RRQ4_9AGAM|nr:hypothetical protein FA95DRAFT_1368319 [Auriscalpium vulgare]
MANQFSFGPNGSYFLKTESNWAWSDHPLPEPLKEILTDPGHPYAMKYPYDVALGMEPGTYTMFWRTSRDVDAYEDEQLGSSYAKLRTYVETIGKEGGRTSHTTFGPNASYFAISPNGFSWQNLPEDLETDILMRIKKTSPGVVALGVSGTYVVLYGDGRMTYDLDDKYPAVDALLRDADGLGQRNGISYLALNPYVAGQYYAVFGNGSARWNVPQEWSQDVQNVAVTIQAQSKQLQGTAGVIQATGNFAVQAQAARFMPTLFR